jgi:hypothetical protein
MATEAGDLVTGGLIAAAVEPGHGPRHDPAQGGQCLNCGAALSGQYCASCGQAAHIHKTVGAIWHELLHGVLHLDGKLLRTLPELALRPGALTRRYIDGERAKFISPLALFLFSALLMYATYSIFGSGGEAASKMSAQAAAEEMRGEVQDSDERIRRLEGFLAEPDVSPARRAKLETQLAQAREARAEFARAAASASAAAKAGGPAGNLAPLERMQSDREFVSYKLKANAYKFSWALILISTPMVWLLFAWKRGFGLYDHAVFVTYSIGFMSLLFSAWTIASGLGVGHGLILVALMAYGLWHMYAQLKGAYLLGTGGALWRVGLLYSIAAVSGGMFYALVTIVS